jgi:hypothetical protein
MAVTSRLALPLIEAAQAQKHVTHNEALARLDRLVQSTVLDRDLAVPPAGPAEGDSYIVAASPTGAWAGHAGAIAVWSGGGWAFVPPAPGHVAWAVDEGRLLVWTGSAWQDPVGSAIAAITTLQNLDRLGLGTTADAVNPLAAKVNKALLTARTAAEGGDGDLRVTFNKEAPADVLSLLMQSGFSGRAEIGLVGDDDLAVKVSADGTSWTEAMRVDRTTGALATRALGPAADNAHDLGSAMRRWSQIYAASATISTSDARDKRDVVPLDLGLGFVRRLNPVWFRRRGRDGGTDGRRRHAGLIAQEVAGALDGRDAALWTRDAASGREGLRYEEFVPVLIQAVKELDARVDALAGAAAAAQR